ncbi:MAG: ABC transporter permease [Chloroflexi bacterium]|uniref:ABC transporter permease n=1 Tax=Candidatus Flexifilum breve TaxID=3140694 RepID=UPI0031368F3E|nr:ABC transporter permease [Chloroflexota bacterium]
MSIRDPHVPQAENAVNVPQNDTTRTSRRRRMPHLLRNRKVAISLIILSVFGLMAIFAPQIAPGRPLDFVGLPHQAPSTEHLLGTTGQGQDVFTQLVHGARRSLMVGIAAGLVTSFFATVVGISAGYFGGRVDTLLSMLINVFLIIPGLPLLVALAAFLPPGEVTIIFALAFTGWAWTARVIRAQTLSVREKDFVLACIVSGDSHLRVMFVEILPNMASIVAGALFGSITYGIAAQAGLEFLGLGNISSVSWGTILYWAGNNSGLLTGAWWTFVPAGLCIALVAFALAMLNYAMDEITNPRLRVDQEER